MKQQKRTNTVRAITAVGLIASAITASGCTSSHHHPIGQAKPACSHVPQLTSATPTVAVLGQEGTAVDAYRADVVTVTKGAEQLKARLLVNGVGSDASAPSLLTNSLMVGEGNNPLERTTNVECKETAVTTSLDGLRGLPDPKLLDDFGAIKTVEGTLADAPQGSGTDVVLFGLLLNTVAPGNLSDPGVLSNPAGVLNTLAAAQMRPNCKGWRVYAIGGGQHTTPPLDDATIAELREFWRQYFQWCGGALVAWSPHLDAFPIAGGAIAAADMTQIPITREADKVTATLSGDVLFDPGHSELRPAAAAQLGQVLTLAVQVKGRIVIDGYTDVGGDETDNIGLSQRRAATVREWLSANGIDPGRITPVGHGSAGAVFTSPQTPDEHQANRRVTVTIDTN